MTFLFSEKLATASGLIKCSGTPIQIPENDQGLDAFVVAVNNNCHTTSRSLMSTARFSRFFHYYKIDAVCICQPVVLVCLMIDYAFSNF